MINVNELKLGNLISYLGKIYPVELLNKSGVGITLSDERITVIDLRVIEPVVLTEEFLIKVGGKLLQDNPAFRDIQIDRFVLFCDNEHGYSMWVGEDVARIGEMKYVHQFQNAWDVMAIKELVL